MDDDAPEFSIASAVCLPIIIPRLCVCVSLFAHCDGISSVSGVLCVCVWVERVCGVVMAHTRTHRYKVEIKIKFTLPPPRPSERRGLLPSGVRALLAPVSGGIARFDEHTNTHRAPRLINIYVHTHHGAAYKRPLQYYVHNHLRHDPRAQPTPMLAFESARARVANNLLLSRTVE